MQEMTNTGMGRRSKRMPGMGFPIVLMMALLLAACSMKKTAANIVGDTLAGSGGVYASDDDPELIREAIPFGLKTYESLLEVSLITKESSLPRRAASPHTLTYFKMTQIDLTRPISRRRARCGPGP
jgi:hypothetical protein